ncbi:MAG: hypothetical protein ACRC1W_12870 [Shewanella sp.]
MTKKTKAMREAFEKWAVGPSNGIRLFNISRVISCDARHGDYCYSETRDAYITWKAATLAKSQKHDANETVALMHRAYWGNKGDKNV